MAAEAERKKRSGIKELRREGTIDEETSAGRGKGGKTRGSSKREVAARICCVQDSYLKRN
jgi:hypothetical protein